MTTQTQTPTRYGIDAYLEWCAGENIPIYGGLLVDMVTAETADWPRYGVKGAIANFEGRGDFCSMFKIELPPGTSTLPQHHLYEEICYVVEGRGSTQFEFGDGTKRSFEWGPRSLFAIPLNAKHRHFNASGTERAIVVSTTTLPIMMKMFHNERFIFENDFAFDDRMGKQEYYTGEGDLTLVKPGQDMWETNFVPDLAFQHVTSYGDRGGDSLNIKFILADSCVHAHISEMKAGTYKKGHRHGPGTHVMCVTGTGYTLFWNEGDTEISRLDWKPGCVFPPADRQFHQHFVTSDEPVRYLATAMGSIRYPVTNYMWRALLGSKGQSRQASSLSTKEGGDQVEYEDQDPRIHQIFLDEMKKAGLPSRMQKWFPD
jgi:mannose-6-phosphate isomerase-like protein (cupin superfamily)